MLINSLNIYYIITIQPASYLGEFFKQISEKQRKKYEEIQTYEYERK